MLTTRRSFLTGLAAGLVTAPAIVRAASLMPVKAIEPLALSGRAIQMIADQSAFRYAVILEYWRGETIRHFIAPSFLVVDREMLPASPIRTAPPAEST
jgi:hypothetical protein